ncbi:MAG: hypothetical protein DDT20_01009 [Firmicutes bacterium]|nr:hypothetical protein [Bacillota bacterium]
MQFARNVLMLVLILCCGVLGTQALARDDARHSIIINLPEFRLRHFVGQALVAIYPISISRPNTPTPVSLPTRRFEIFTKVRHPAWRSPITGQVMAAGPANPLGTRWLGLMTIDPFIEVFHDVYGRMRDKTQHLDGGRGANRGCGAGVAAPKLAGAI